MATAIATVLLVAVTNVSQRGVRDVGGFPGVSIAPETRVRQLYVGVPQRGTTLGSSRAPLRMVEFIDLQCPYCAEYSRNVLPSVVNNWVRTKKVQLEVRLVAGLGPDSSVAARAAASAAAQNRMYQFIDFFLLNQGQENGGYVTEPFLRRLSRQAGVPPGPVISGAHSLIIPDLMVRSAREARRHRVTKTPTFLLGTRRGPLQKVRISQMTVGEFSNHLDDAYALR